MIYKNCAKLPALEKTYQSFTSNFSTSKLSEEIEKGTQRHFYTHRAING